MAGQRQMRIEQRGGLAALSQLESRSDEELERETRNRAAALALLGSRAAERYDAKAARRYFQQSMAAARPQERPQIRKMAEASLALAERRTGDLKEAVARMGQEAPSGRQLFLLRISRILVPGKSASTLARIGGALLILLLVLAMFALAVGIVALIVWVLPGSIDIASTIALGVLLLLAVLVVLIVLGRRRQSAALAKRAEQSQAAQAPVNRAARRRN